jgi:hypothetical protein
MLNYHAVARLSQSLAMHTRRKIVFTESLSTRYCPARPSAAPLESHAGETEFR